MSGPSDAVGYKNPPSATRRKKRQSGNPGGRRRAGSESAVETIDRLLMRRIRVVENGRARRMTILQAIVMQLCAKENAGNPRALNVRLKYEELARGSRPPETQIEFVDDDYTRALGAGLRGGGDE